MPAPETSSTLAIEKPAAGGRMLARLDGQVALVAGAIPGERVTARVEQRARRRAVRPASEHIDQASPDRRSGEVDPGCGGSHYAHIAYDRQLALKKEIVRDAFQRIAKLPVECPMPARTRRRSTATGCARGCTSTAHRIGLLPRGHARAVRPGHSRQLLDSTLEVIAAVSKALRRRENRVGRLARPE